MPPAVEQSPNPFESLRTRGGRPERAFLLLHDSEGPTPAAPTAFAGGRSSFAIIVHRATPPSTVAHESHPMYHVSTSEPYAKNTGPPGLSSSRSLLASRKLGHDAASA